MEMYGEDGTVEIGSAVLLELKENENVIESGVPKFLRRLYSTCAARKLIIWRINKKASAVWSMTGSTIYPANSKAYSVMVAQAERNNAVAPPPIPCGAVMLINNEERGIIEEKAHNIVRHVGSSGPLSSLLVGRASSLDITMIDMGAVI